MAAWPAMVSEFTSSGMSAEAFSQQQGVSLASLKYWQERLRGTAAPKTMVVRARQPPLAEFVDLGALRGSTRRVELRLELGDGVLLTLSRE